MIRVSKNMKRGALINDLNEIVQLAEDKCSVVNYPPTPEAMGWASCFVVAFAPHLITIIFQ